MVDGHGDDAPAGALEQRGQEAMHVIELAATPDTLPVASP